VKKALLICYYFPPLGLAGVGRPLNLFKRLPEHGYDCEILTVKPVSYWEYERQLLDDLDKSKIYRAGSRDPQRIMYLLGVRRIKFSAKGATRRAADRFFPDSKIGWVKPAVRLGRTLMENHCYDIVISTSPPMSAHLVGKSLAAEFNVPWVADMRDYWTISKLEDTYADRNMINRGERLLNDIQKNASAITAVNQSIAEYWGSDNVIPNGFDIDLAQAWMMPPDKTHFHIGVPGNLLATRIIDPLLRVLSKLREQDADLFSSIRLLQVGSVDREWLESRLDDYALKGICEIHGYVPRTDFVTLLSRCSLTFVALGETNGSELVPSRVFELLASGRPILVYGPAENAIRRLFDQTGNGFAFDDTRLQGAVDYLRELLRRFRKGDLEINPLPDYAKQYSSDSLAKRFAELMDRLS
jgi:glycosyltransferase involved in cell wall biosynthesis